jgi:hypothetical protein
VHIRPLTRHTFIDIARHGQIDDYRRRIAQMLGEED